MGLHFILYLTMIDFDSLFQEIRKALHMMMDIAVDLEKDNESAKVFYSFYLMPFARGRFRCITYTIPKLIKTF